MGLLRGMRVVDMADEKGELCGRLLSDFGADVIRVESPGGAVSRRLPPFTPDGELSLYFAVRNAGKRSIALDLTTKVDRERLHVLLERADVLIESHAPGFLAANGLDPAGRRAMLRMISRLAREQGKSFILSSHLLEDVDQVCDAVLILKAGQVLAHGRIDVLRSHRRNRYRLDLEGAALEVETLSQRLRREGVVVEENPREHGCELLVEVPAGFRTQQLETHVLVDLDVGGRVLGDPRISRRSGNPWYDDGVVRAIQKASPLPAPPEAGEWAFVFVPEDSY